MLYDNNKTLLLLHYLYFLSSQWKACKSRPVYAGNQLSSGDSYDVGVEVNVFNETENPVPGESLNQDSRDTTNNLYAVDLTGADDIYKDWEKG